MQEMSAAPPTPEDGPYVTEAVVAVAFCDCLGAPRCSRGRQQLMTWLCLVTVPSLTLGNSAFPGTRGDL